MSMITNDNIPEGWIKRQSKSHPGHYYYFNTATRESKWTVPSSVVEKKLSKGKPTKFTKVTGKDDGHTFKLSEQSKQIKKRHPKTPAQDRLKNLVTQINNATTSQHQKQIENATPAKNPPRNIAAEIKNTSTTLKSIKKVDRKIDLNASRVGDATIVSTKLKTSSNLHRDRPSNLHPDRPSNLHPNRPTNLHPDRTHKPHKIKTNVTDEIDKIPTLFPPKTPGQDRLNRLRNSLNPQNENVPLNTVASNEAVSLIRIEFGFPDQQNVSANVDEVEAMDWEPSDIFEEIEKNVCSKLINPYIVPDTNVFLDDLSCIRDTIRRDTKYNVLVPFIVLQELDNLKGRQGDSRISVSASAAIRFIYNELKSKRQRLQGQKAVEDLECLINVINSDDKILNCCLQFTHQSREIILITNDKNLSNKGIASGVTTLTSDEYKSKCS